MLNITALILVLEVLKKIYLRAFGKTSRNFQTASPKLNSLLDWYILLFTIFPIQKRIYFWRRRFENNTFFRKRY